MADKIQNQAIPPAQDVSHLVADIIADAKRLMQQQIELAKLELKEEWKTTRNAAYAFGSAIAFFGLALMLFFLMMVHVLDEVTELPLWSCFGIVAGFTLICGVVMLLLWRAKIQLTLFAHRQSIRSIQEAPRWDKNKTPS